MSGGNADVLNLSKLRGSVDGIVPSVIAVGRETTIPDETGVKGRPDETQAQGTHQPPGCPDDPARS
jgi:hypothetical protein